MDLRVRRRDLKPGKIFICNYEGTLSHPTHSCPLGDPVVIKSVYPAHTTWAGSKVVIAASGAFQSRSGEVIVHSFRLCDLRKMTKEDW